MERVTVTAAVNIVIVCQMTVKGCVKISVVQLGHSTGTVTWVRAAPRAVVARAGSLSPNIRLCVFSVALSLDRYIHFSFRPIIITKKHHGYVRSEADWGLYDHLPGHPEEQEAPLRCLRHQGGADRCGNCKLTSTFETPTSSADKDNWMHNLRLVHATVPLQSSWLTSTRRRARARTADTASMTTSILSVPTAPSQPSNPNCSWWVGARMAPRSRRKCSTRRGDYISSRCYAIGHISLLQLRYPEESICGSSQGHPGKRQERVWTGYYCC